MRGRAIRLRLSFVSLEGRLGVRGVSEVSHGEYFQKENLWQTEGKMNRCRERPHCGVMGVLSQLIPMGSSETRMALWCFFPTGVYCVACPEEVWFWQGTFLCTATV